MDGTSTVPTGCLDSDPIEPRRLARREVAAVARALAHPVRLEILDLFHDRCPRTVGDIVAELPLAQSTISAHLRILRDADIVRTLRADPRSWHCLNRSTIAAFLDAVSEMARRSEAAQHRLAVPRSM
jgi:ArsR family transcriptional regulator